MAATEQPVCDFGRKAIDFRLKGTDGRMHALADVRGKKGTLVVFICNHCPYVKAVADRLARDVKELQAMGIGVIAVNANDPAQFPEDAPERMTAFAKKYGFTFPYVYDESQETARAYGAVCTPDFFGYNKDLELQYRGRLDSSRNTPGPVDARRELVEAMRLIAETGRGPKEQTPSIGCSIKWRRE